MDPPTRSTCIRGSENRMCVNNNPKKVEKSPENFRWKFQFVKNSDNMLHHQEEVITESKSGCIQLRALKDANRVCKTK